MTYGVCAPFSYVSQSVGLGSTAVRAVSTSLEVSCLGTRARLHPLAWAVSLSDRRERQDFSEEAEKKFQEVITSRCFRASVNPLVASVGLHFLQSRKAWLAATSSEDIKEWYRYSFH